MTQCQALAILDNGLSLEFELARRSKEVHARRREMARQKQLRWEVNSKRVTFTQANVVLESAGSDSGLGQDALLILVSASSKAPRTTA